MKITKQQLRRIIKEEKQRLLSEQENIVTPASLKGLEETIAEMVEDLIFREVERSGLELTDEVAMAVAAGIDRAKGILRY